MIVWDHKRATQRKVDEEEREEDSNASTENRKEIHFHRYIFAIHIFLLLCTYNVCFPVGFAYTFTRCVCEWQPGSLSFMTRHFDLHNQAKWILNFMLALNLVLEKTFDLVGLPFKSQRYINIWHDKNSLFASFDVLQHMDTENVRWIMHLVFFSLQFILLIFT